jgi:hypothetical protein
MNEETKNDNEYIIHPRNFYIYFCIPGLVAIASAITNSESSATTGIISSYISTIFSHLSALILVFIPIPPVIWVISVSLLGKAIKIAKNITRINEEKTQRDCETKIMVAQQNLADTKNNPEKMEEAMRQLNAAKKDKNQCKFTNKKIMYEYNLLSVTHSIVIPCILLLISLILAWLHPLYKEIFVILSIVFTIIIIFIITAIVKIYTVMKVIEKVSQQIEVKLLEIITAIYVSISDKNKLIEVTSKLNDSIKDNRLDIKVSNETMGKDPDCGVLKKLAVKYKYNDKIYIKECKEGEILHLP